MRQIHESIDVEAVLYLLHSDYEEGWCIACGVMHTGVDHYAVDQKCPNCGELALYGSFALMEGLTGEPAPPRLEFDDLDA